MLAKNDVFKIIRTFDAPKKLVWDAWTKENHFSSWFGPKGSNATVKTFDFKEGGILHTAIKGEQGPPMWAKIVYKEIQEPSKLVYVQCFADENANMVASPFGGDWPQELLTTVTFVEKNNQTEITLTWKPINATEAETQAFINEMDGMNQGWGGSFDKLDDYLLQIG